MTFKPKKIDLLILRAFIGPFLATFLLSSLVFLLQFLWKYIDELIGKGLEVGIILEFLFYAYVKEIFPLAMPMAILLASIMTFGNLAEKFELVALKSAGIPLRRIFASVGVVALFFSACNFLVLNQLSPVLTLKWVALYYDIHHQKPTFDLQEGVFYKDLEGYSIKISKKDDDGKTIHNVVIYDQTKKRGNINVITAEKGEIEKSKEGRFLYFTLYNGNHYEELKDNPQYYKTYMHNSMKFSKYKIAFDLMQFNMTRTAEDLFKDGERFKNMSGLEEGIDSLHDKFNSKKREMISYLDENYSYNDTVNAVPLDKKTVLDRISPSDSNYRASVRQALQLARTQKSILEFNDKELDNYRVSEAKHKVEWHRKITYSITCFILFLIGAPLGAIVRKGGFGMPVVIAISFFILYYILNIIGEKTSKELVVPAMAGMWLPVAVLFPIGLWLIFKSSRDKSLFDVNVIYNFFKGFSRWRKKKTTA